MTTVRLPRKSVLYQNVKLLRTDKARASCAIDLKSAETYDYRTIHARIQKIFWGGGGTPDPLSGDPGPLWIRPCDRLAVSYRNVDKRQIQKSYDAHMNCKHIRSTLIRLRICVITQLKYEKTQLITIW